MNLSCDAAVLVSPIGGDTLLNVIADYNPRPLMLVASQGDSESLAAIQALQSLATGEVLVQSLENPGRGGALVQAQPDLFESIVSWLQRHLVVS